MAKRFNGFEYNFIQSDVVSVVTDDLRGWISLLSKREYDIMYETLDELRRMMDKRIFDLSLNSNLNNVGDYGTKQTWVLSRDDFAKPEYFDRQIRSQEFSFGKKKKKKKKKKATKELVTIKKGWKNVRDIQGLRTNRVDFQYTGSLRKSFKVHNRGGKPELGFRGSEKGLPHAAKAFYSALSITRSPVWELSENEVKYVDMNITESVYKIWQETGERIEGNRFTRRKRESRFSEALEEYINSLPEYTPYIY